MAAPVDLSRIQSLVTRLTVLGNVQRGDVIRAQQWNELVSVVLSLAQTVAATQADHTVPPHDHTDQVKLSWLDPSLRALVEKGPLSDPISVGHVAEVDRRVTALVSDLDTVRTAANSARDRLTELSTREVIRDASLTDVRRIAESFDQRKDAVGELRKSLDTIQSKVDQAISFSSLLTIDGQPADLKAIDQRIKNVEGFRKSFTLPNGQLLDANTFETRITDVRNGVVTQEQLDKALKLHGTEVPKATLDGLHATLTTSLRAEFNTTFDKLKTEVNAGVDKKIATVDPAVAAKIDERLPAAIGAAVTEVKAQIVSSADQVRNDAKGFAADSAAKASDALRLDLSKSIGTVQGGIPAAINAALDLTLPTRFVAVEATAGAAKTQAADALGKITAQGNELSAAKGRTEQVALQSDAALKSAQQSLLAEIGKRETASKQDLDKRFVTFSAETDTRIDNRLTPRLTEFQAEVTTSMQKVAAEAANTAVKSTSVQLRAEMIGIARDQALALKDVVRSAVVADLDSSIAEKVNTAVKNVKGTTAGTTLGTTTGTTGSTKVGGTGGQILSRGGNP